MYLHLSAVSWYFYMLKLTKGMTVKLIVFTTSWVVMVCWGASCVAE